MKIFLVVLTRRYIIQEHSMGNIIKIQLSPVKQQSLVKSHAHLRNYFALKICYLRQYLKDLCKMSYICELVSKHAFLNLLFPLLSKCSTVPMHRFVYM